MCQETECGCGQHGQGEEHRIGHGHGECWSLHGHLGGRLHHSSGCCCHGGSMSDCGCESHHGSGSAYGFVQRHFVSKEEMITGMEEYLKQLRAEAAGVEEHIDELRKTG